MNVLAIDIGASSGRHILGTYENGEITLQEVYRFPNGMQEKDGVFVWDVDALWKHILCGMKKCAEIGKIPSSVGIDTWGVDTVLLDSSGNLCAPPVAYRTGGTEESMKALSFPELYARTGIAQQPFNTVYRLMSTQKDLLERAERCLFIPDYFHYRLTGRAVNEFTESSTSALLNVESRSWDAEVFRLAGIPQRLFPEPPVFPGTGLGILKREVAEQVGYSCEVILPASHDTGSAYMAVPSQNDRAVTLSSGTWSLLGIETDRPVLSEAARKSGFTNEGAYGGKIRFLRNIMGLWVLQCIRNEQEKPVSFAEMTALAEEARYEHTVDIQNNRYLAPKSMSREFRRDCLEQGVKPPETLGEMTRCAVNSLAKCYADAVGDLETITGKTFECIHIVGGGCQNEFLNLETARRCGIPVHVGPVEATALGNVCAQLIAQNQLNDPEEARSIIRKSFPVKIFLPEK